MPSLFENVGTTLRGVRRTLGTVAERAGPVMEGIGLGIEAVQDPQYFQKQRAYRETKERQTIEDQKEDLNRLIQAAAMTVPGSPERLEFTKQIINHPIWPKELRQRMQRLYQPEMAGGQQPSVFGFRYETPNLKQFYNVKTGQSAYFDISQQMPDPNVWSAGYPYDVESRQTLLEQRRVQSARTKGGLLSTIESQLAQGEIEPDKLERLREQAISVGYDIVEETIPGEKGWFRTGPPTKKYRLRPLQIPTEGAEPLGEITTEPVATVRPAVPETIAQPEKPTVWSGLRPTPESGYPVGLMPALGGVTIPRRPTEQEKGQRTIDGVAGPEPGMPFFTFPKPTAPVPTVVPGTPAIAERVASPTADWYEKNLGPGEGRAYLKLQEIMPKLPENLKNMIRDMSRQVGSPKKRKPSEILTYQEILQIEELQPYL